MSIVYLNGDFVPRARAVISVDDRGFTFGDGIYEGVRAIEGRLFSWPAHAARMKDGLAGLRIAFAGVDDLEAACARLLDANELRRGEAFLYLAVSRGAAPRTHAFPTVPTTPTVFASATAFVPPRHLRTTGVAAITHDDLRWARCDLKTINLLGSVIARQAAVEAGAYEAILIRDGVITEGAATSVLAVIDGELRTHPRSPHILPSVTRHHVLDHARALAIPLREVAFTRAELARATEVLLCGTTNDVTPVVAIDGAPVGGGAPGPIGDRLRAALDAQLYGNS
ncbi:MAG TPA: aminotransferase class IV [Kofleriaceae bacterium]|nr:aminotransferase class IV [Kofleriaceae bacterium]